MGLRKTKNSRAYHIFLSNGNGLWFDNELGESGLIYENLDKWEMIEILI